MCSLVTSTFLYACESWTLTGELKRRIQAMKMRCYRKKYYTSHTKTMLPTTKSMPRSSRQLDHMKTSDDHKETQTAVVWSCYPFIRSGQNHLARHSERGQKTRPTEEEVGRQHGGMDRPGVRQCWMDSTRVDIPAHARTAHKRLLQKRLEEDLC